MFKRKGGGVKGFLNNVKKTALFLHGGLPNDSDDAKEEDDDDVGHRGSGVVGRTK